MVFDRISQEKEFAWKYAELMEKLTQQDKLKTIESLNLPVMTEGVLFYMLDLV